MLGREEETSKLGVYDWLKKRGTKVPSSEELADWNWFQKVIQKTGAWAGVLGVNISVLVFFFLRWGKGLNCTLCVTDCSWTGVRA